MASTPAQPEWRRRLTLLFAALTAVALAASSCSAFGGSDDAGPTTVPDSGSGSDDEQADGADPTTSATAPDLESTGEAESDSPAEASGVVDFTGASGYSNDSGDYLGNPIWVQGPSNVPVKSTNDVAVRFVARQDGQISRASFIIKYDFERDGYHGGDCGVLEVTLRPDLAGQPGEEVLATMVFDDPCGGVRNIGWLTDQPFAEPATVVGGDTYHLVFRNLDPDPANFVSINMLYGPDEDPGPRALSTGEGQLAVLARGSEFWSGNGDGQWGASDVLADHYPSFELHYADDTSQGVSYVGARFGSEVLLSPENPTHLRQVFPLEDTTTVRSLWFRGVTASDDAEVAATVALADGTVLFSGPLPREPGAQWFGGTLPVPLTLVGGSSYTVELAATAGSIEVRPLYQAQHDDWTSTEQSDWSGGVVEIGSGEAWETYVNGVPHDLSLYFETGDPPVATTTTTVALYGDSLVGETTFDQPFEAALAARNLTLAGKDNNPGRDVSELLATLTDNPIVADIYVINIGINGGQSAAQFEATVRSVLEQINLINPDARVLWTSIHALPVTDFVFERVEPRNEVLESLATEGALELIPWFDVASLNTDIYGSDGVHFFGNEMLYAQTMVAGIDRYLAAG